ncbi:hypothetical protein H4Q26_005556 [Puccinia striiformis f. sp. tritici PST-130]|nr:hypothetical protein H4Q26_005556 [Puccinia striiformis f. sp. tritici PST-130]
MSEAEIIDVELFYRRLDFFITSWKIPVFRDRGDGSFPSSPSTHGPNRRIDVERVGSETGQEVGRLRDGKPVEEEFMHEWNDFLEIGGNTDLLAKAPDVSAGVSVILGPKDPQEIYRTDIACQLSRKLMSVVRSGLLGLLKTEDKNTLICKKLRALIKRQQKEGSIWEGAQYAPDVSVNLDISNVCLPACLLFNRVYSILRSMIHLKTSTPANYPEARKSAAGTQYKSYPSDVSRTIMINSCPNQEDNYVYLLELQKFAIKSMKEGIAANELYHAIKAKVATERPELKSSLPQSFGSALGVEFDDSDLSLNANALES